MPVIVFASPKGGAGKTTSSLILACELAARGLKTALIDADPNHPISKWRKKGRGLKKLNIIESTNEEKIIDDIDAATETNDFVIVDLEGTANLSVAYAISRADLVIIPSQRSALDAGEAAKAIALIKNQSKIARREIPFSVLLTRTNPAIRSKGLKRMIESLDQNQVNCLITELQEREAYKAIFDYACPLSELETGQVSGLDKARTNAANYAAEVIKTLQKFQHNDKKEKVA